MSVKRFGVSLDEKILNDLDDFVKENHFPNRSQAIRFLIEDLQVEQKWKQNNIVAGAIVFVYDHHKFDINNKSNEIQHKYHQYILATQHIHLNHNLCLETITVRGKANELTKLTNEIITLKGVKNGKIIITHAE